MKRFCLLLFISTALSFSVLAVIPKPAPAQKKEAKAKPPAVLKIDTGTQVNVRPFSADSLRKFSAQRDFNYEEQRIDTSWWHRFWRWFWHLFEGKKKQNVSKSNRFWTVFGEVLKYTMLALGVGAIILIILKVAGVDISKAFKKRSKSISLPYSEYQEDINAIEFDQEIESAISHRNYRLAVRLLYLKCLKKLSDAGLIDWQISKTNTSYVNELADADKRGVFGVLTRRFEYVWYGEFDINQQTYNDIQAEFGHFNSSIK